MMITRLSRKKPLREESQRTKEHVEGARKVDNWRSRVTITQVLGRS